MSPRKISQSDFQNREIELIEIARRLVEQGCLTTLTIDRLVVECPYSKGTVYKHFTSKEDLLMAICNTCVNEIQSIFTRALQFKGNSRERILAVLVSYVIWAKLHPSQLFTVLSAHSPSVMACCSDVRNSQHADCESSLMGLMNGEIEKAIASGDLVLPTGMTITQVTFSLWSASWGAMALIMSKRNSKKLSSMQIERESFMNAKLILNGFGWKPLSQDWNYRNSLRQIADQIFKPEIEELETMGTPFIFMQ